MTALKALKTRFRPYSLLRMSSRGRDRGVSSRVGVVESIHGVLAVVVVLSANANVGECASAFVNRCPDARHPSPHTAKNDVHVHAHAPAGKEAKP